MIFTAYVMAQVHFVPKIHPIENLILLDLYQRQLKKWTYPGAGKITLKLYEAIALFRHLVSLPIPKLLEDLDIIRNSILSKLEKAHHAVTTTPLNASQTISR